MVMVPLFLFSYALDLAQVLSLVSMVLCAYANDLWPQQQKKVLKHFINIQN
jgi:hypothetical protein